MKSFKEIADGLQKQAGKNIGISSLDVKIIYFGLVHELSAILGEKGQHESGIHLFDAWSHLKTLKSKDDEKSN